MGDFWSDMLQQQKDSVPAVREDESRQALEALEQDYGIMLRPMEAAELERGNFQVLPADSLARLSGALQQVPGLIAGQSLQNAYQSTYANAYRLLIPAGSDNLSFMKNSRLAGEFGEGAIDLTLVDSGGTIRRKAGAEKIDPPDIRAQQIAYLAFSAASLVTNQYFLQRIDKKLKKIQQTTTEILQFLELDKLSALEGHQEFLEETFQSLPAIQNNPSRLETTRNHLIDVREYARRTIGFYNVQTKEALSQITLKAEQVTRIKTCFSSYWLALYVYELAVILEILLHQITDSRELQRAQADLQAKIEEYTSLFSSVDDCFETYVRRKHPVLCFLDDSILPDSIPPVATSMVLLPTIITQSKKAGDADLYDMPKSLEPAQLQTISESIDALDKMYRSPTELAISGEKVYLKLPEYQKSPGDDPDVELRMREKE